MLQKILDDYLMAFPGEEPELELLLAQLAGGEKMNDRYNFHGHVTGSGIVLSPDRKKVLLIHHRSFNRWQQPGGHWESEEEANPLDAAQREVEEETGITVAEYLPFSSANPLIPLDIDSHQVPARPLKHEPAHWHHDFRYVFIAGSEVLRHQEAEVSGAGWFDFDAPESNMIHRPLSKLRDL